MVAQLGALKMALVGSAAAVTLAAGGITLGGVLAIFSSATGILVSIATLTLMARKYLQGQRSQPPPPLAPVPPPGLPLGRVTKEEYARALAAQVHYSQELLRYADQMERYYQKHRQGDGT